MCVCVLKQNRTDVQCQHRWQKVLNPELIKGPWTKEEDQRVSHLLHWASKTPAPPHPLTHTHSENHRTDGWQNDEPSQFHILKVSKGSCLWMNLWNSLLLTIATGSSFYASCGCKAHSSKHMWMMRIVLHISTDVKVCEGETRGVEGGRQ